MSDLQTGAVADPLALLGLGDIGQLAASFGFDPDATTADELDHSLDRLHAKVDAIERQIVWLCEAVAAAVDKAPKMARPDIDAYPRDYPDD